MKGAHDGGSNDRFMGSRSSGSMNAGSMNGGRGSASKGPMTTFRSWSRFGVFTLILLGLVTPVAALKAGEKAPEIAQNDLDGKSFKLSSMRGKVVVVDFWASWCKPCRAELPALDRLYKTYRGQGLEIIGVSLDQDADAARAFLRDRPVSFRNLHDDGKKIADQYGLPAMPSSYLIDRSGTIRHVHAGFRAGDEEIFKREIEALLK